MLIKTSAAFLSGIVVFLGSEHVCLDTKLVILSGLEAEILVGIGFYMAAVLNIQDGWKWFLSNNGKLFASNVIYICQLKIIIEYNINGVLRPHHTPSERLGFFKIRKILYFKFNTTRV